jgi:hypothetical protein
MADNSDLNGNPNTNGDGKGNGTNPNPDPKPDDKGKPSGNDKADDKGKNDFVPKADFESIKTENENLRGTQKALQEQIDKLKGGFKQALGISDDDKTKKTPEEMALEMSNRISTLETSLKRERATNTVSKTIENYKDENGKYLSEKAVKFLKEEIVLDTDDAQEIQNAIAKKVSVLSGLMGEEMWTGQRQKDFDLRPPVNTTNQGNGPKNANEILDGMRKK